MIIGKKRKGILRLMRIGLICLKASVYAEDRLSKKEGFVDQALTNRSRKENPIKMRQNCNEIAVMLIYIFS